MSFHLRPHIEQAKKLIKAGDQQSLVYAALELRFGIERMCYEKLKLRLGYMSYDELRGWQPRRVIETIQELADPDIHRDAVLGSVPEDADGRPQEHAHRIVIHQKGIDPKSIGKEWNKLGFFLHVHVPKTSKHRVEPYADPDLLKKYLLSLIRRLEEWILYGDFYLSEHITFICECSQEIVRNVKTLQDRNRIRCSNSSCTVEYIVYKDGDEWRAEEHIIPAKCERCGTINDLSARKLLGIPTTETCPFSCYRCGQRYVIGWMLRYSPAGGEQGGMAAQQEGEIADTDATLHEHVQRRAYGIWEQEGRPEGCAETHWLRAEFELRKELATSGQ